MNPQKIIEYFSRLKFDDAWAFSHEKYEVYSHNYHRYPAKFISPLADKLIKQETNKGDCVVDIFGGCGTTLLQAKLLGRRSYGFDINPVAQLISQVKVKAIEPSKLTASFDRLKQNITSIKSSNQAYNYDGTHEKIRYWFSEHNYQQLSIIYEAILQENNSDIKRFFICAFSHCLKNSSRWLMKSIKPTVDKHKSPSDPIVCFTRHAMKMVSKNFMLYQYLKNQQQLKTTSVLYLSDITTTTRRCDADLIITSPPYVTSYEYADLHQLTVLWLGVHQYTTLWKERLSTYQTFRQQFIGSSASGEYNQNDIHSTIGTRIVEQLSKKNKALAYKVSRYYGRMYKAFSAMNGMLSANKKSCVVLGNTKLLGVDILNAEVALEQLLRLGFRTDTVIKRNANTNKMIAPFRDSATGKFTTQSSPNKRIAYSTEYIIKVQK